MTSERVREVLGVWAPMGFGVLLIVVTANFYLNAPLGDFESWRSVCALGVVAVAVLLLISTTGRYRKLREARRDPEREVPKD